MKTLKITCFICAGYYALHAGLLLFNGYMSRFMKAMIPPDEIAHNPILQVQEMSGAVAMEFAPYLLIGLLVCILLGFLTRPLWKIIPVVAIVLFAGSVAWGIAYYMRLQPYYTEMNRIIVGLPGMNGALGSYVKNSTGVGQYASCFPLLMPGFAIFIFWWKSRKEVAATTINR